MENAVGCSKRGRKWLRLTEYHNMRQAQLCISMGYARWNFLPNTSARLLFGNALQRSINDREALQCVDSNNLSSSAVAL